MASKTRVLVAGLRPQIVTAWFTEVPGLVAWNHPGKYDDRAIVKTTWQLLQAAEYPWLGLVGYHLDSAYKLSEVRDMAAILAPLGDWSRPFDQIDTDTLTLAVERLTEWWKWKISGRETA